MTASERYSRAITLLDPYSVGNAFYTTNATWHQTQYRKRYLHTTIGIFFLIC